MERPSETLGLGGGRAGRLYVFYFIFASGKHLQRNRHKWKTFAPKDSQAGRLQMWRPSGTRGLGAIYTSYIKNNIANILITNNKKTAPQTRSGFQFYKQYYLLSTKYYVLSIRLHTTCLSYNFVFDVTRSRSVVAELHY